MRKNLFWLSILLLSGAARASVTLPYTFSPGGSVSSSQMNADLGALRDEINTHESQANGHNTTLSSVLTVSNSCGSTPINFNGQQGLNFLIENVSADPVCAGASSGRMIYNTTSNLLKVCNGSSFVSIAGTGVNTLSSVLNAGNSAGSFNLDMNENQLLHARVENLSSDPSAGNIGRLYYNTTSNALKLDTGSSITAIGGSQGLSSVLGVSNSAGSTNINFNGNQALDLGLESLAVDPGTTFAGRLYYNSTVNQPKFYNGSSWLTVGNTNTLAQTLALGNSAGSSNINFNGNQAQNMRLHNLAAPPGTGTAGTIWYDTINNILGYETTTVNHTVCSLDDVQTLTNKAISGASNTLTNIPDNALSSNVALLNNAQSITGTKTFSSAPVISNIKTPAGTTLGHTIPNGLADDTFVLANAVQTLAGKTLSSSTVSGALDFNENQALHMRVENVTSLPAAGNAGRVVFNTGGQTFAIDSGTAWYSFAGSPLANWANILANGNSAGSINPDFNYNQALHMDLENLSAAPSAGHTGRLWFNTTSLFPQYDNGTSAFTLVDTSSSQNLTNKTIVESLATVTTTGSIPLGQLFTVVNCSSACTQTLPSLISVVSAGQTVLYDVKMTGTGTVTIAGNGADTIDGAATAVLQFTNSELTLAASTGGWLVR